MSKKFVTLFRNDGRLHPLEAKPFVIEDSWSIEETRNKCHERLHSYGTYSALLYTELGIELDNTLFIPDKQVIIVTSGEPFVPINYSGKINTDNADVQSLNELVYLAKAGVEDDFGNFGENLKALEGFFVDEGPWLAAPPASNLADSTLDQLFNEQQFSTIDFNVRAPVSPSESAGSETDASHRPQSSLTLLKQRAEYHAASPDSSPEHQYRRGDDKVGNHKQSEIKSREKLKQSIKELVLSVPTLNDVKNPTKATIFSKATDYIKYTKKAHDNLLQEHKLAKDQINLLQTEAAMYKAHLEKANLVTVEIVDAELRYIFVDHMWEVVMGYRADEVIGKCVKDVVGCGANPLLQSLKCQEIHQSLSVGRTWCGYIISKRRDGRAIASECTIQPVIGTNGRTFQHVTTRRQFHLLSVREIDDVLASAPQSEQLQQQPPSIEAINVSH